MKQIFTFLLSLVLLSGAAPAMAQHNGGLEWHTDLMKAQALSKSSGKPIFGFFTGSDWCGWCRKLQMDVFSKPSFVKWAKEKVILLELDFPHGKKLPDELAAQNNSLQQAFQVRGYPTIWMFNMEPLPEDATKMSINALGQLGYPSGAERGKEEVAFLAGANEILAKAKKGTAAK